MLSHHIWLIHRLNRLVQHRRDCSESLAVRRDVTFDRVQHFAMWHEHSFMAGEDLPKNWIISHIGSVYVVSSISRCLVRWGAAGAFLFIFFSIRGTGIPSRCSNLGMTTYLCPRDCWAISLPVLWGSTRVGLSICWIHVGMWVRANDILQRKRGRGRDLRIDGGEASPRQESPVPQERSTRTQLGDKQISMFIDMCGHWLITWLRTSTC
jgi:hypothetical protein